jgi:hypothetical protein
VSVCLFYCAFLILDEKISGGIFIELSIAGNVNMVIRIIFATRAAKTVPVNTGIINLFTTSRSESVRSSLTASSRRKRLTLSSSRNPVIDIICTRTNATALYQPSF